MQKRRCAYRGARGAYVFCEHGGHQRRGACGLRAARPCRLARGGPRASTCVRHSMYDRRGERRQHAHAHRQPAEHLSLKRIRHERGGTRGHHGSVFCRGIRVTCGGYRHCRIA